MRVKLQTNVLTSWYNLYQHHNDTADLRSCDCIEPNEDRYNKGMELLIHERESTPSTIPTTILQCPIDDTDSSVPDMFTVSSKDSDEDYSNMPDRKTIPTNITHSNYLGMP
jgi:hypothetical protein